MPTTAGLVHLARARRQTAQTFTGVAALALPAMLFEIDAIAVR